MAISPKPQKASSRRLTRNVTPIRLRKALDELRQLNRTLRALGLSNQALMRAKVEADLVQDVCRIIEDHCGHAMVWIGYAEEDAGKSIRPVAWAGFEKGYLETLNLTWADEPRGHGPTGTAIRTGKPSICRDMRSDARFGPWRTEALQRGYSSSVALPLPLDGQIFGALTIYSREADAFSEDEVRLLSDLANDLAYGIANLRLRRAHEKAVEDLAYLASFPERNPSPVVEVEVPRCTVACLNA